MYDRLNIGKLHIKKNDGIGLFTKKKKTYNIENINGKLVITGNARGFAA